MLPVEVLVPGANSRSTCKHFGIYTGPSLLEPYKSHKNIYIYKAAYDNMMNHVIIFLVLNLAVKMRPYFDPLRMRRRFFIDGFD